MYYQYSESIGSKTINKNFVIDKKLFELSYGFTLQELLSDYNIKPCDKFDESENVTIISNCETFINDSIGELVSTKHKKIIFIDRKNKNETPRDYYLTLSEDDFPLSITENRRKIIVRNRNLKVCNTLYSRLLCLVYKLPRFPKRIEMSLKRRLGIPVFELEAMLSNNEVFLDFNNVIDNNGVLSISLIERCWLAGISVNSKIVDRKLVESDITKRKLILEDKLLK